MTTAVISPFKGIELKPLKPMALLESVLLFGIPGMINPLIINSAGAILVAL